ncbi:hypothetical protein D3C87_1932530 [compost metagenome]
MANEDQQAAGAARLQPETAALRQSEPARIAVDLEQDGRKRPGNERRIGQPKGIFDPTRQRVDELLRPETEITESRRIGKTRLARHLGIADDKIPGGGGSGL